MSDLNIVLNIESAVSCMSAYRQLSQTNGIKKIWGGGDI